MASLMLALQVLLLSYNTYGFETMKFGSINRGKSDFDCPMRQLAMKFAEINQPWLSQKQLNQIADALSGSTNIACNLTENINLNKEADYEPIKYNEYNIGNANGDNNNIVIFVDDVNGDDIKYDGSKSYPFKTLQRAVIQSRKYKHKTIFLREGRYYLGDTIYFNADDSNLFISNYNNENVEISGALPLYCDWKQSLFNNNIYECLLNSNNKNNNITDDLFLGLRVNGSRGIRARYPNNNPETNGFGSKLKALSWKPPTLPKYPDWILTPDYPFSNQSIGGFFQHYTIGLGGPCNNFLPSAGYWCSLDSMGGGPQLYTIPSGLVYNKTILPNTPYANTSFGIVQAWRPSHWASWMFEMTEKDNIVNENTLMFSKGGYQGARGAPKGDEFFVENIFEELDYPTEWFYNRSTRTLYYYNNNTDNNTDINDLLFEATQVKVLFNYTGTMEKPVDNLTINGMTFRDTVITYMEPHSIVSGGDWALQRTAALYLEGTQNVMISNNLFTRMDGNAIGLNKYNQNVTIYRNEIVWNGDTAIYAWGDTKGVTFPDEPTTTSMGWDGTDLNQPRFINISYNLVHELGIFEKQSSFYFQAKSCQNYIGYNILFNGPRAGINLNDGFGGGSIITKNLIFNFVRESGDHGPINSWDRQVYVTKVRNGTASVIKAIDKIYKNFIIGVYSSQESIDNDDGSCFYNTSYNFLVYADYGMKSDFGGHSNFYHNNILAYLNNNCFGTNGYYPQYIDRFYNNTCIMNHPGPSIGYGKFNCSAPQNQWPYLANNLVQCANCNATSTGLCGYNEVEFQQKYNYDHGTVVTDWPNNTILLQQAEKMIFSP